MDIFNTFATDPKLEKEGAWIPFEDAEFLVARTGTRKYAKLLGEGLEKHKIALDVGDDKSFDLSETIMVDSMSHTILLGWKGKVTYQGKDLPYTIENAKILLKHKDFRHLVLRWADDINNFREKEVGKQAKNS